MSALPDNIQLSETKMESGTVLANPISINEVSLSEQPMAITPILPIVEPSGFSVILVSLVLPEAVQLLG